MNKQSSYFVQGTLFGNNGNLNRNSNSAATGNAFSNTYPFRMYPPENARWPALLLKIFLSDLNIIFEPIFRRQIIFQIDHGIELPLFHDRKRHCMPEPSRHRLFVENRTGVQSFLDRDEVNFRPFLTQSGYRTQKLDVFKFVRHARQWRSFSLWNYSTYMLPCWYSEPRLSGFVETAIRSQSLTMTSGR